MKHPLDRAKSGSNDELQRVIGLKKDALPRRATLDLQKRPRSHVTERRTTEFVRIAREEETAIWQR
jgi:hypothetical protein